MTRPNRTPYGPVPPQPGDPVNESARAHVTDEIVTGVHHPREIATHAPRPPETVTGVPHPRDRARYTGFDWVASLLGFAVAVFFLAVFLGAVAAVMVSLGYRPATGSPARAVGGPAGEAAAAGALAATFLAYLVGGYAAGRVARFSGGRNGLGVVLWTLIVAVLLGITGAVLESRFGVAGTLHLHLGVSLRDAAVAGAVAAVPTLVVMIVGGLLGGALGRRYHRRVDRAVGVPAI